MPNSKIYLSDTNKPARKPDGFEYVLLSDLESNPLPFKDDTFDLVTCLEVIEHLASPDNLIFEIARVLKSNGRMILSTPNLASWSNRAALLLGYFPISMSISAQSEITDKEDLFDRKQKSAADAKFDYHVRAYTASALKIILQLSNFRISRIKIVYGYKSKGILHFINKFFEIACPSLAQTILLEATS